MKHFDIRILVNVCQMHEKGTSRHLEFCFNRWGLHSSGKTAHDAATDQRQSKQGIPADVSGSTEEKYQWIGEQSQYSEHHTCCEAALSGEHCSGKVRIVLTLVVFTLFGIKILLA